MGHRFLCWKGDPYEEELIKSVDDTIVVDIPLPKKYILDLEMKKNIYGLMN